MELKQTDKEQYIVNKDIISQPNITVCDVLN